MKLLLVTPACNEGRHIQATIESVLGQELRPAKWVIVDDGSSDETRLIAETAALAYDFIEVSVHRSPTASGNGLANAREASAFMGAIALENISEYDAIGKLDADVVLPPFYYRVMCAALDSDRRLGICGGRIVESTRHGARIIPIPSHHVHGALKLYRRACFERIGGIPPVLGWDTLDEAMARRLGYVTRSLDDVVVWHSRPWGTREGRIRGKVLFGRAAYICHYPATWVIGRSLKSSLQWPGLILGAAEVVGYFGALIRRVERYPDDDVRRHIRGELRARRLRAIRRISARRSK